MSKFIINEKVFASSKCTLMQGSSDPDPCFCKVVLTEDGLIFLNDEYLKQGELLIYISISRIRDFIFINEKKQKKSNFISFFGTLIGSLLFAIGGHGFYVNKANNVDLLYLLFVNEQGEEQNFILNMMEYGENGLIREYKKLVQQ